MNNPIIKCSLAFILFFATKILFGQLAPPQQVEWQALTNATVEPDGSVITTVDAAYQSSGYSTQKIAAGKNGYFEFTINNQIGFFGLTSDPQGTAYNTIDYAFQTWWGGNLYVKENGADRGRQTGWVAGDVVRVEKIGTTVIFKKNGTVVYTAQVPADQTKDYYADFSVGNINRRFDAPNIKTGELVPDQPSEVVRWKGLEYTAINSEGDLEKTIGASWNGDGNSKQKIKAGKNGFFEFTVESISKYLLAGLSVTDDGNSWNTIDHAVYLAGTNLYVYTNGSSHGASKGTIGVGSIVRIAREENDIVYYIGGVEKYREVGTATLDQELMSDVCLASQGAKLKNANFKTGQETCSLDFASEQNLTWQDLVNINVNGNHLTATNRSVGRSNEYIPKGNFGYYEMTLETNSIGIFGLCAYAPGIGPYQVNNIYYGFDVRADGTWRPFESGSKSFTSTWSVGDKLKVVVRGETIMYQKNGFTYYTSTLTRNPMLDLHAGFLLPLAGHSFSQYVLQTGEQALTPILLDDPSVLWNASGSITTCDNGSIVKDIDALQVNGTDNFSYSEQTIGDYGYIEFDHEIGLASYEIGLSNKNDPEGVYNVLFYGNNNSTLGMYYNGQGATGAPNTLFTSYLSDGRKKVRIRLVKTDKDLQVWYDGEYSFTKQNVFSTNQEYVAFVKLHSKSSFIRNVVVKNIRDASYSTLDTKLNSQYFEADDYSLVHFIFDEKYNRDNVVYNVYDYKRNLLISSETNSGATTIKNALNEGYGKYAIDVSSITQNEGYYFLEVLDANNKKYKLRFKI